MPASFPDQLPLPEYLQHKPIFGLPFFNHDPGSEGDTDCQHLSVGWSQWNDKEISAKVFRHAGQKWSRQSEELPLARLVDLTSFVVLVVNNADSESLIIPAGFFEQQPKELIIRNRLGSDAERKFYRQSLVDNELLERRLDRLTDLLLARRQVRGTV